MTEENGRPVILGFRSKCEFLQNRGHLGTFGSGPAASPRQPAVVLSIVTSWPCDVRRRRPAPLEIFLEPPFQSLPVPPAGRPPRVRFPHPAAAPPRPFSLSRSGLPTISTGPIPRNLSLDRPKLGQKSCIDRKLKIVHLPFPLSAVTPLKPSSGPAVATRYSCTRGSAPSRDDFTGSDAAVLSCRCARAFWASPFIPLLG